MRAVCVLLYIRQMNAKLNAKESIALVQNLTLKGPLLLVKARV